MKKNLIFFFIGILIASFVSYVIAETYISADKVSFENDKSIKTNVDDALDELYENVDALDKADATANQILEGKKVAIGRKLITGSMPNLGAWTSTPTSNGKVTIPAGYHDGSGYVDTSNIWQSGYDAGYGAGGIEYSFFSKNNVYGGVHTVLLDYNNMQYYTHYGWNGETTTFTVPNTFSIYIVTTSNTTCSYKLTTLKKIKIISNSNEVILESGQNTDLKLNTIYTIVTLS